MLPKLTQILIGWTLCQISLATIGSNLAGSHTLTAVSRSGTARQLAIARNRARPNTKSPCLEYSRGFVLAKTKRFYIEICGSRTRPLTYYISKNYLGKPRKSELIFDIRSYRFRRQSPSEGEFFVAVKSNLNHTLTRRQLTIRQKGSIVLTEPVIYYRRLP